MEAWALKPLYGPSSGSAQGSLYPSVTVIGAATATPSTRLPGAANSGTTQIQIANITNQWAYVNFGNLDIGTVTAATVAASYPVAPGTVVVVTVGDDVNGASVILGGAPGTATSVIFTRGSGM